MISKEEEDKHKEDTGRGGGTGDSKTTIGRRETTRVM
jgi:hypothetical protein